MDNELNPVDSHRAVRLAQKFHSKEYRDTYVESHTRRFLAHQMREFRGDNSQTEFGHSIGKSQTIVSRLEDPTYSGWTLRTLFDTAQKLNVAVVVRFVNFQTFLHFTDDMSEAALRPAPYEEATVDQSALDLALTKATGAEAYDFFSGTSGNDWSPNQSTLVGYGNTLSPIVQGISVRTTTSRPFTITGWTLNALGGSGYFLPDLQRGVGLTASNFVNALTPFGSFWPSTARPDLAMSACSRKLAASEKENARLKDRVKQLEDALLALAPTSQQGQTIHVSELKRPITLFSGQQLQGRAI